jgi:hypothetical protein
LIVRALKANRRRPFTRRRGRVGPRAPVRGDPATIEHEDQFEPEFAEQSAVVDGLRLGWLEEPEDRMRQYFGLQGDGAAISIELTTFTDGAGGTAARVVGSSADGNGRIGNLQLQVDIADFTPPNLPNGGTAPFYNDRIIAHEVVHAVQYRSLNVASMNNAATDTPGSSKAWRSSSTVPTSASPPTSPRQAGWPTGSPTTRSRAGTATAAATRPRTSPCDTCTSS